MNLNYHYQGEYHSAKIDWTENSHSVVFRNIGKELESKHNFSLTEFDGQIKSLDDLAGILYEQIHTIPEYTCNTYNPALPKILQGIMSELTDCISRLPIEGQGGIFRALCEDAAAIFQNMVEVFLEDNRYQGKMLKRDNRAEKYMQKIIRSTMQEQLTLEFEEVVLQMTDLANVLDCLTNTQKRRLVQHVILGYTITHIAELENNTSKQSVHESIKSALTKLKENLQ